MQTGWDDSHVEQTRLIGLRAPLPNYKPSLLGTTLLNNLFNFNNKKPDNKIINSIDIICDTLQIVSHKESIKRLINISNYKDFIKDTYFDVYFRKGDDTTIYETPEESLNNLIETLRDIVKDNTYIRNKYKLDYSISKEQIYEKLIEHLEKIKSSKLTIDERDKILEQSGGNNKQYKEILGKRRRIYKIKGSRKEHVKYKGELIPVSDYKKLVKK
jgi:hypothetical protein